MQTIQLAANLLLLLQPDNNKLRLVVTDGHTELACRKETVANLRRYLSGSQNRLFKGRLQLHKDAGNVSVVLKGDALGVINTEL